MYYSEEARNRAKQERTTIALLAMLVGAGLGAVITLLFAPFSGEQARSKLEDVVETGKDQIEDGLDRIQEVAS